jgi:16S rRNA (cytosine1402-N4)-methyltransferase
VEVTKQPVAHIPVLAKALAKWIDISDDAVIVDATVGQAGHGFLFAKRLGQYGTFVGLDVDEKCIGTAREKLKDLICKVVLVRENFANLRKELEARQIKKVDFILADLGVCSAQFADSARGLSFQTDMPLDMRLDGRLKTTAADIVNGIDERSLADLIYKYGQERGSRRIARFIVQERRQKPINSTVQLAGIVCKALARPVKTRWSRIHPATRTFQALRIAVNSELDNLQRLLCIAPALLRKGGYIAIISFHSLEDKLVKENFRQNDRKGIYKVMTKKPIRASREEVAENPRARSAKLRIAQML